MVKWFCKSFWFLIGWPLLSNHFLRCLLNVAKVDENMLFAIFDVLLNNWTDLSRYMHHETLGNKRQLFRVQKYCILLRSDDQKCIWRLFFSHTFKTTNVFFLPTFVEDVKIVSRSRFRIILSLENFYRANTLNFSSCFPSTQYPIQCVGSTGYSLINVFLWMTKTIKDFPNV